jgi:CO dehydrogenase maturation factor
VLALDADPDANLACALGYTGEPIVPMARQVALIEERTGAKITEYGQIFKLNPDVSDIAERFAVSVNGVDLITLGAASRGGGGCACPESAFIKALVTDMVLYRGEALIMDMEAGIEHLGRATASGVDAMLIVVEPGERAIVCARSIERMCREMGLRRVFFIANKTNTTEEAQYIAAQIGTAPIMEIPYLPALRASDRPGVSVQTGMDKAIWQAIDRLAADIAEINNI